MIPVIFGIEGFTLTPDERAFFKDADPAGVILFKRNVDTRQQVYALTQTLHDLFGRKTPILIDQEGGRVQRLRAPNFVETKALGAYASADELDADQRTLARQLKDLGITVNCTPVLDVVPDGTGTQAIGDRSFGSDPVRVADMGRVVCDAHMAHGVTPVIKHLPGHGRATCDSHFALPVVDADPNDLDAVDFAAFRDVAAKCPDAWGMTTHIVFPCVDAHVPVTLSADAIQKLVRGACGFSGLLLSDDLFMDALKDFGDAPARVAACLNAGVDIALHCHGSVADMARAADAAPAMRVDVLDRLHRWSAA